MHTTLAIDPGPSQSALVAWDGERIVRAEILPNENILWALGGPVDLSRLYIEMIASYGMPVGREVFETCVWIGRFVQAWTGHRPPSLITRHTIKLHHCRSARAKDSNVRQALIDKYGAPGTKANPGRTYGLKADLWQAFALATYATEIQDQTCSTPQLEIKSGSAS